MKLPKSKRGFTLIELLIVIALLGALAVGLIGALDPFEQLKKGTDTGTRDLVNQMQTGIIRYYSIKNNMPWCPTGAGCPADPSGTILNAAPIGPGTSAGTAIANMILAGELKANFDQLNAPNVTKVFVTGSQTLNTVTVCYSPTSKSFQADPNTKYTDNTGVTEDPVVNGVCKSHGGNTLCFWCVK